MVMVFFSGKSQDKKPAVSRCNAIPARHGGTFPILDTLINLVSTRACSEWVAKTSCFALSTAIFVFYFKSSSFAFTQGSHKANIYSKK